MARVIYIEANAGAAGDMLLGALIDAGLPVEALREALGTLGVGHELVVSRVVRAGVSATHVSVVDTERPVVPASHRHPHSHEAGHAHTHPPVEDAPRTLADIRRLINASGLSAAVKSRAVHLFERLGEAEAAVHGVRIDEVHFHEVGAVDSIVDIVGCVFGFEWFGIHDIVASPVNVGGGTVEIAHGVFPVPAPATLRLLAGVPVYSAGPRMELTTPTGALLISNYATAFGPMPPMTVSRVGYGAGTRDMPGMPNVVRLIVGERAPLTRSVPADNAAVLKVECEIDDMNPQIFGAATERVFDAGALDVVLTAVQMKKGRPGTRLTVLAPVDRRAAVVDAVFTHTTTIGVRIEMIERETLDRRWVEVTVDGGIVRMKLAERAGRIVNAAPEFDDCLRIATATGRPIKDVQIEAMTKWRQGS